MTAATNTRNVRTFSSGDYISGLMAELSKAAIAQRVAQARKQAGLTQEELADLLHVHTKTVQNWEAKTHPIVAYDRLDDVARASRRATSRRSSSSSEEGEWLVADVLAVKLDERV